MPLITFAAVNKKNKNGAGKKEITRNLLVTNCGIYSGNVCDVKHSTRMELGYISICRNFLCACNGYYIELSISLQKYSPEYDHSCTGFFI